LPPSHTDIAARLRAAGCVFADDEADLLISAASSAAELATMVEQRADGFPLEQVVGWAEFCGLRIRVVPGVFVPRRRSEFVVARAIAMTRRQSAERPKVIVDLCCGTGAIGVAVTTALARIEAYPPQLHAVDIDPTAVACAKSNLASVSGRVYLGDLYAALPGRLRGQVDLLIANAPYVPTDEIELLPAEARLHEPRVALDGGGDGVDLHRKVAAAAPGWLGPDGCLLIETSERQAALTSAAVIAGGLAARTVSSDELSATVVIGTWPD
jgi:release factor glutamine methyltransferase